MHLHSNLITKENTFIIMLTGQFLKPGPPADNHKGLTDAKVDRWEG